MQGITTLTTAHPEKFNAIGGSDSSVPFATIFTGMMLVQLFYWGTNQAIIQRALGAKSLVEMGYDNIAHVDGGFAALKDAGATVKTGDKK